MESSTSGSDRLRIFVRRAVNRGFLARRFLTLNLVLSAGLAGLTWEIRQEWEQGQQHLATLLAPIVVAPVEALEPAPSRPTILASRYVDVATKNLFSQDRNPNIVVDPPAVEAPRQMPAVPVILGVMGLPSGTRIIVAERVGGPSSIVRIGDTVGEFKIAAMDQEQLTFEWQGTQVTRRIDDLVYRSGGSPQYIVQQLPVQNPGPIEPLPALVPARAANTNPTPKDFGRVLSASMFACKADDTSAYGARVGDYRKASVDSASGPECRWVR